MKEVKKGTNRSRIKKGDTVVFIAGKEYNRYDSNGKRKPFSGQVIAVDPREGRVKVEGAAIVKRHRKPVPQLNREGGIIESEGWVNISNVALLDPKTGKPTRVRYEDRDGVKVRVAKSGEVIGEKKETKKKVKAEKSETAPKKKKKPAAKKTEKKTAAKTAKKPVAKKTAAKPAVKKTAKKTEK